MKKYITELTNDMVKLASMNKRLRYDKRLLAFLRKTKRID